MVQLEDAMKLKVDDLKKELKNLNASTSGKKLDLAQRYVELLNNRDSLIDGNLQENENCNNLTKNTENNLTQNFEPLTHISSNMKNNIDLSEDIEVDYSEELDHDVDDSISAEVNNPIVNDDISAEYSGTATTNSKAETENPYQEAFHKEKLMKLRLLTLKEKKQIESNSSDSLAKGAYQVENPTCHVRIDNFQRPLILKNLVMWLSEVLQQNISISNIWLNSIKTHCYIDFDSTDEALKCIQVVTGLKFPESSSITLVANFTRISAIDAPTSAEGNLRPGMWLSTSSSIPPVLDSKDLKLKREVKSYEEVYNPKKRQETLLTLEQLFEKTKSIPPLFWQPVSKEEVSKRKLLKKRSEKLLKTSD